MYGCHVVVVPLATIVGTCVIGVCGQLNLLHSLAGKVTTSVGSPDFLLGCWTQCLFVALCVKSHHRLFMCNILCCAVCAACSGVLFHPMQSSAAEEHSPSCGLALQRLRAQGHCHGDDGKGVYDQCNTPCCMPEWTACRHDSQLQCAQVFPSLS